MKPLTKLVADAGFDVLDTLSLEDADAFVFSASRRRLRMRGFLLGGRH